MQAVLYRASLEIKQQMAPKSRLIILLMDNLEDLSLSEKQNIQNFITKLSDVKFVISLCVPNKSKFREIFPAITADVAGSILDSKLFSDPNLAIPYMQRTNRLAAKAYNELKKIDELAETTQAIKHAASYNPQALIFSSLSRFPTRNTDLNVTLNFLISIIFFLSLKVLFCSRAKTDKKINLKPT